MKKILFVIHDLGQGGAEKVLVNLVNNMDESEFDISVLSLFGGGVNEQFLKPTIHFRSVFARNIPGNSKLFKLLTPEHLYKLCIRENYDIVVSYLEGPTARVVSGCWNQGTKLVSWIHREQHTKEKVSASFRSSAEAERCYNRFNQTICVSQNVLQDFTSIFKLNHPAKVLYNTVEDDVILEKSKEQVAEVVFSDDEFKLIATGSLKSSKGFDRLIRIHKRLRDDGLPVHTYILGRGPEKKTLQEQAAKLGVSETLTLLGYHTNPYKFVAKSDLFVCSSFGEGFSTATTEALIVGTPVCTVEVAGMKEMLGKNNEYGVVTENTEDALYQGILEMLTVPGRLEHYKKQALIREKLFDTKETVSAVEHMLSTL